MPNVTMQDVAREANVSKSTVSHVINHTRTVDEKTRKTVEEAMAHLSYVPNALARSLRRKSTNTIGIVISDIGNSFFTDMVRACEDAAYKNGYNTILCNSDEDPGKERMYLNILQQKQVDGVILSPTGQNADLIRSLNGSGMPVLFVDRYIEGMDIDFVGMQNFQAAYKSVKHLYGLGHRKIALMYTFAFLSSIRERIDGYKQALQDFQIDFDEKLMIPIHEFGKPAEIREKIKEYLTGHPLPDCIFVLNNFLTIETIGVMRELKLKCPQDLAISGMVDFYWAWAFEPYLTMTHTPVYDIGSKAVEILISKIRNPDAQTQRVEFPTELIVRDSCGAMNGPVLFSKNLDDRKQTAVTGKQAE